MTACNSLTDAEKSYLKKVADFCRAEVVPHCEQWEKDEQLPRDIFTKAGKIGLTALTAPKDLGGLALSYTAYALVIREIARHHAALAMDMAAHNSLCLGHILHFGSDEQKKKYIPKLATAEWLGAWALTEPNAGSDTGGIETQGKKVGDDWEITGHKKFITAGRTADILVVMAATGVNAQQKKEISAFILQKSDVKPSSKIHTYGMRSSDTAELKFEKARGEIIGQPGEGHHQMLATLDRGRVGISALAIGIATAAHEAAIAYAQQRKQFGHPIADFQAIQTMLADSAVDLDASELLMLRAAKLQDAGQKSTLEASMAKLFSSEAANRVCNRAMQIHGGYGYSRDLPIERYLRDAKLCEIGEGTSQVQRLVIARELLKKT